MRRYLFALLFGILSAQVWAADYAANLQLATAPINRSDIESIKRGAKFFATNCMSCHTLVYLRYNQLAQEQGITYDKMPIDVKTWPNGITPPDLSLETNVRGVNWVYTYLHSFYKDSSRPSGVNNLLVPGTGMPGIISPYQGEQELVEHPTSDFTGVYQWYDLVKLTKQGSMTPEDFDQTTADLVNFLAYAAEPYHAEQQRIGMWVLMFLILFTALAYLLKREYWKDVKKHKE